MPPPAPAGVQYAYGQGGGTGGGGGGSSTPGPAFRAYQSSAQTLAAGATKVNFQTETFDTAAVFASSRFTPNVAGYYHLHAIASVDATSIFPGGASIAIQKNGSNAAIGTQSPNTMYRLGVEDLIYLNGSTDYVEVFVTVSGSTLLGAASTSTYFTGHLARAA